MKKSTMARTVNLKIRIEPKTKAIADNLFQMFGIIVTDAVKRRCVNGE